MSGEVANSVIVNGARGMMEGRGEALGDGAGVTVDGTSVVE